MPDHPFNFSVIARSSQVSSSANFRGYLVVDNWDDWFTYSTMYTLLVFSEAGERISLGYVKIGQFKMTTDQRRPELENRFEVLDERFFSLGQSEEYYEQLGNLDALLRESVVKGLRDVVDDLGLWEKARKEDVTKVSLTRSVSAASIKGQFRRLLGGGAKLTPYQFAFAPPKRPGSAILAEPLTFGVRPESDPPTNVHVLIGRNGVGKTRMLHLMTKSLVSEPRSASQSGKFSSTDEFDERVNPFAGVVTVSFSAFDEVELLPEKRDTDDAISYYYIGLRRNDSTKLIQGRPKTPDRLATEFVNSMKACLEGPRMRRWHRALEMLEADPIFKEAEVIKLAQRSGKKKLEARARWLFKHLSSGHKIVLLTITRLVEVVEEKTLVLIDEPEAHLHPPLLSAFVRSLSDLLINRNGVAIIATHSPVVLQEVPKTCVWMLRRSGHRAVAERPECETFGENVGVLTREVFKLEVTQTGFHRLLSEAVGKDGSFESLVNTFDDQLGAEAKAMLRALIATRRIQGEQ